MMLTRLFIRIVKYPVSLFVFIYEIPVDSNKSNKMRYETEFYHFIFQYCVSWIG